MMISVKITYDDFEPDHYEIKIASNKTNLNRVMKRFVAHLGEDITNRCLRLHESNTKVSLWYFNDNAGIEIVAWYYKEEESHEM